jgi:hypothetical protein
MGALLVLWLRPAPAEMEPFFTGPNNEGANRIPADLDLLTSPFPGLGSLLPEQAKEQDGLGQAAWIHCS